METKPVIAGLDPAIHLLEETHLFRWMRGSSPRMTIPNEPQLL
jgi:hypothetical protein